MKNHSPRPHEIVNTEKPLDCVLEFVISPKYDFVTPIFPFRNPLSDLLITAMEYDVLKPNASIETKLPTSPTISVGRRPHLSDVQPHIKLLKN